MYAAYDALSDNAEKDSLDGLTAHHDGTRQFGAGTPEATIRWSSVIRWEKLLYVNEAFTSHINEIARRVKRSLNSCTAIR